MVIASAVPLAAAIRSVNMVVGIPLVLFTENPVTNPLIATEVNPLVPAVVLVIFTPVPVLLLPFNVKKENSVFDVVILKRFELLPLLGCITVAVCEEPMMAILLEEIVIGNALSVKIPALTKIATGLARLATPFATLTACATVKNGAENEPSLLSLPF